MRGKRVVKNLYKYHINKYNPKGRELDRYYIFKEWGAISDIGTEFDGKVVTIEEYQRVEDAYIRSIELILDFLWVPKISAEYVRHIASFDEMKNSQTEYPELYAPKIIEQFILFNRRKVFRIDEIKYLCRLMLREEIASLLYYKNDVKIFIGYDYLMSILTSKPIDSLIPEIESMGLYVEEFSR